MLEPTPWPEHAEESAIAWMEAYVEGLMLGGYVPVDAIVAIHATPVISNPAVRIVWAVVTSPN